MKKEKASTSKDDKKSSKECMVVEPKQEISVYQQQQASVENMIMQAIKEGTPVETLERVLAMRDKLKAEYAKEQFDKAMANFQMECPIIKKNKQVFDKYGKLRYSFASIDSIISQTKKLIADNGLSYRFKNTVTDKTMVVECIVTHTDGHSESSPFTVNLGTEEYMTDVQKSGARSTFAKRYSFCDAFGIMTGDEDTDAKEDQEKAPAVASQSDIEKAFAALDQCMTIDSLKKAWSGFSKEVKANKEVIIHANEIKSNIEYENSQNGATE